MNGSLERSHSYAADNSPPKLREPHLQVVQKRLDGLLESLGAIATRLHSTADNVMGVSATESSSRDKEPMASHAVFRINQQLNLIDDQVRRLADAASRFEQL